MSSCPAGRNTQRQRLTESLKYFKRNIPSDFYFTQLAGSWDGQLSVNEEGVREDVGHYSALCLTGHTVPWITGRPFHTFTRTFLVNLSVFSVRPTCFTVYIIIKPIK